MAIGRNIDVTQDYKNSIYNLNLDMSGWDTCTIQLVAPVAGAISVYGSNDSGAILGVTQGNAELATHFTQIQGVNLATSTAVSSLATAGLLAVPINAQYLKITGLDVYKMILFNSKIG